MDQDNKDEEEYKRKLSAIEINYIYHRHYYLFIVVIHLIRYARKANDDYVA